jgi:hypothetical protein
MRRAGALMSDEERNRRRLWRIKMAHTVIWAVFAGAILAIPVAVYFGRVNWAFWLSLLVWIEVLVLVFNRMRCPLTGFAERYTDDRSGNFDIFIPEALARNNKLIFGILFAAAEIYLLWRWLG